MIKSENYINVCGWMISELADLRLNEIFIYAIIHGFSQDGKSFYTGSLSYLMEWTHSSKPTVIAALSKMVEKGYIIKKLINGVTPIYFTARSRMMDLGMSVEVVKNFNHQSKNLTEGSKKTLPPQLKNFTANGKESLPNNTNNNLENTATAIKQNQKSEYEAAAADFIFENLKKLFGGNIFDSNFIPELSSLFEDKKLDLERVGEYLDFVYKRTLEKKPNSISNLFRTLAKSENVLQDYLIQNPVQVKKDVPKKVCPICGKEEATYLDYCSECNFCFNDICDEKEIAIKKQVYKLPKEQRESLDNEIGMLILGNTLNNLRNPNFKEEQEKKITALYKKYGINA